MAKYKLSVDSKTNKRPGYDGTGTQKGTVIYRHYQSGGYGLDNYSQLPPWIGKNPFFQCGLQERAGRKPTLIKVKYIIFIDYVFRNIFIILLYSGRTFYRRLNITKKLRKFHNS